MSITQSFALPVARTTGSVIWTAVCAAWRGLLWFTFPKPLPAGASWWARAKRFVWGTVRTAFVLVSIVVVGLTPWRIRSWEAQYQQAQACVTKAIVTEAAKEPKLGRYLVGVSIMARKELGVSGELPFFPKTLCGVTHQPATQKYKMVMVGSGKHRHAEKIPVCSLQYDGVCNEDKVPQSGKAWEEDKMIAGQAMLSYYFLPDWMQRMDFYARHPSKSWGPKYNIDCATPVGHHVFCEQLPPPPPPKPAKPKSVLIAAR